MEKISHHIVRDFPAANLYLDDIIEIAEIVKENSKTISIEFGGYRTDKIDEIKLIADKITTERIDSIEIEGRQPNLSIRISKQGVHAHLPDDSTMTIGTGTRIQNVIKKRRKINPSDMLTWINYFNAGVCTLLLIRGHGKYSIPIGIVCVFLSLVLIKPALNRNITIHTRTKRDTPNFFTRQKDTIIVNVAVAVISALLTIPITWYFANAAK